MTTPRRYNRYDALHLVHNTLAQFQVDMERNDLGRRYPTTNFGCKVRARHRDLNQATGEIERAYQGLIQKLKSLGGVKDSVEFFQGIVFEGRNCNYTLHIERTLDWDDRPRLDVAIYSSSYDRH